MIIAVAEVDHGTMHFFGQLAGLLRFSRLAYWTNLDWHFNNSTFTLRQTVNLLICQYWNYIPQQWMSAEKFISNVLLLVAKCRALLKFFRGEFHAPIVSKWHAQLAGSRISGIGPYQAIKINFFDRLFHGLNVSTEAFCRAHNWNSTLFYQSEDRRWSPERKKLHEREQIFIKFGSSRVLTMTWSWATQR